MWLPCSAGWAERRGVTTRIAIALALLIAGGFWWDNVQNDGTATLFLLRRLAEAIEWLAFWR